MKNKAYFCNLLPTSQVKMLRIVQERRQCDDVSIKLHVRGKILIKNNSYSPTEQRLSSSQRRYNEQAESERVTASADRYAYPIQGALEVAMY